MGRKRVDAAPVIKSWPDLDQRLKRRRALLADVTKLEAAATGKVEKIKQQLKDDVAPLKDEIKRIEKEAEDFCEFNRDQFGGQKSRKLDFGIVGWRKSPGKVKTLAKWTFGKAVEKLGQLKMTDYLRQKPAELDKDAVKEAYRSGVLSDTDLKKVGLKIEEPEEFFVEQDEVKAAEMPGQMDVHRRTGTEG